MADDFADEDFDAFAIALREANPSEVESDFEDQHDHLSLVIDDSGMASRFKARVLPTIVVIDRDGVIVFQRGISKDLTGEDLVAAAKTAVSSALSK
jgi:ClpP class serine protease